jgi:hypothetical protein
MSAKKRRGQAVGQLVSKGRYEDQRPRDRAAERYDIEERGDENAASEDPSRALTRIGGHGSGSIS